MSKNALADRLLTERLLAERAIRELPGLRALSRGQALVWLNALVLDIQRAHRKSILKGKGIIRARDEAIVAIGLLGIALDGPRGPSTEVDLRWDRAIAQVEHWYSAIVALTSIREERRLAH